MQTFYFTLNYSCFTNFNSQDFSYILLSSFISIIHFIAQFFPHILMFFVGDNKMILFYKI